MWVHIVCLTISHYTDAVSMNFVILHKSVKSVKNAQIIICCYSQEKPDMFDPLL